MSNYIQEYWGAYLGAPALQLINYVRRFYDEAPPVVYSRKAKKNIPNPNWKAWTPPRDFQLPDLAKAIKDYDKKVSGRWRTCHHYSAAVKAGNVADACFCGQHVGELATGKPLLPQYPDGRPICHFWRAGIFDLLQVEQIATIDRVGDPLKAATVHFRISVFQPLPLLTPWQVGQLPKSVQEAHERWLSRHRINLSVWGAIAVERLMPLIKIYPKWLRSGQE